MGLFGNDNKIKIKEPFENKYRLTITSDIQTGSMPINTKAEIRWNVKVKSVSEDKVAIEVITLDNQLLESNNPMVKDIANMSQVFAKIYSELDFEIDKKAKLLKLLNIDLIKEKWSRIKNDLKEVESQDPMITQVISLNDDQLADNQTLFRAINNNEFFGIYFHHLYGNSYHSATDLVQNKNILNTILLKWAYRIDKIENRDSKYDTFRINGFLKTSMSEIKKSYNVFSHLEAKDLNPVFIEDGIYDLDPSSGKIIKAVLEKKEIVHPLLLHATIKYELTIE